MLWDTDNTNLQLKKNYKKKKCKWNSSNNWNTLTQLKKSVLHLILGFYNWNTQSA